MTLAAQSPTAPSELRQHWPAVLACFATATFAWGFGFYGQSVYLAELQRLRGWSVSTISGASTLFYLAGALALVRVHAALARFGPRPILAGGVVLLGLGATAFASSGAPRQLYAAALLTALGWAGSSTAAISGTLVPFYNRQRGLATSLALNGASAAGFTVAPALILLSSWPGAEEGRLRKPPPPVPCSRRSLP
jgi:MFS family permease